MRPHACNKKNHPAYKCKPKDKPCNAFHNGIQIQGLPIPMRRSSRGMATISSCFQEIISARHLKWNDSQFKKTMEAMEKYTAVRTDAEEDRRAFQFYSTERND